MINRGDIIFVTKVQLKKLRTHLRLTQREMAEKLGVATNTVSRWEQGVHPIPEWARKILRYVQARTTLNRNMIE